MDKIKILIVEDEEFIALELATRLNQLGYTVCKNVTNATDAIEEVKRCKPDIILMDIRIKGDVDGIELAKTIRDTKKIPIIYITAFSDPHTLNRAKETLPYGYLTKPIGEKDLRICLELATYRIEVERKLEHSQKQLHDSEIKYRTLADYTYDWEYWLQDGKFIYLSPSVERITGYTPEEFFNNPALITEIVFSDDKRIWLNHITLRKTNNYPLTTEFRIVHKDGTIRWIEHICRYIVEENGQNLGLRVSNRDITQQKELELHLINNTIEVEESERSRYSRELHDGLGPLLATIKIYFQWLSETNEKEKAQMLVSRGLQNIEKAIESTRQVSRGLSSLQIDKEGFVNTFKGFINDLAINSKVSITFSSNLNERFNRTTELTLYRIATELVNNSLKYANAKSITISCNLIEGRKKIHFYFNDDGKGFNVEVQTRTSKGIGIPNIQSRVRALGGSFVIESGEGLGTSITIELPYIEVENHNLEISH